MTRIKYPKIPHLDEVPEILNNRVEIYEKIDGANVQVWCENFRLHKAVRSGEETSTRNPPWFERFKGRAEQFFAQVSTDLAAPLPEILPENLRIFGEWLSRHNISYDTQWMDRFYLIDAYDTQKERFLDYEERIEEVTIDGLIPYNMPAPLYRGRITMHDIGDLLPGSSYYHGDKEGLVIKAYETPTQAFAKLLNPQFEERARGPGIERYLTHYRMTKLAYKLRDEGKERSPASLQHALIDDLEAEAPMFINRKTVRTWFHKWYKTQGTHFLETLE